MEERSGVSLLSLLAERVALELLALFFRETCTVGQVFALLARERLLRGRRQLVSMTLPLSPAFAVLVLRRFLVPASAVLRVEHILCLDRMARPIRFHCVFAERFVDAGDFDIRGQRRIVARRF